MRGQEKVAKPLCSAQTGWSVQLPIIGALNRPPRPLQLRMLRDIFLDVASTPPRLRRGVVALPIAYAPGTIEHHSF